MTLKKLLIIPALTIISIGSARADEPSLKDVYTNDFLIGSALGSPRSYNATEQALIKSQFNCATPEVCMKPRPIHPKEDVWTFAQADAYVDFCQQNHIAAFGHTLVWHEDCPDWFFKDGDKPASRELVLKCLENHIRTILTRYKGRIHGWDVVNEAISDNPAEFLRKTKWLQSIGDDYVEQAFRFAQQADPEVPLQYNDYNIEREPKRSKALKLIKDLQSKGIRVATVGIQGHWSIDQIPFADIDKAIDLFHQLGVKSRDLRIRHGLPAAKEAEQRIRQPSIRARLARTFEAAGRAVCETLRDLPQTPRRHQPRRLLGHRRRPHLAERLALPSPQPPPPLRPQCPAQTRVLLRYRDTHELKVNLQLDRIGRNWTVFDRAGASAVLPSRIPLKPEHRFVA